MFGWAANLFANYWEAMIAVFTIPVIIFLALAISIIILCWFLVGVEMLLTGLYNINNPCPVCGSKAQPKYIFNGKEYNKPLRPGVYGIFYQKSKYGKLSTMLINGRWKYTRRCVKCKKEINPLDQRHGVAGYGTDIHIGFVGHKSSGKSYLMINGLYLLKKIKKNFVQTDIAHKKSIDYLKGEVDRNTLGGTEKSDYRAFQFIYKYSFWRPPYHLYFYDVAGEQFDVNDVNAHEAVRFYKNVKSFVFLIDPFMINYTGLNADPDFVTWIRNYIQKNPEKGGNYMLSSTLSSLINILTNVGNSPKHVDIHIVCVKIDMDNWYYYENFIIDQNTGKPDVKNFLCETMGMENLIKTAEMFRKSSFHAVSAIDMNTNSLEKLFIDILKQRSVKIKKIK